MGIHENDGMPSVRANQFTWLARPANNCLFPAQQPRKFFSPTFARQFQPYHWIHNSKFHSIRMTCALNPANIEDIYPFPFSHRNIWLPSHLNVQFPSILITCAPCQIIALSLCMKCLFVTMFQQNVSGLPLTAYSICSKVDSLPFPPQIAELPVDRL